MTSYSQILDVEQDRISDTSKAKFTGKIGTTFQFVNNNDKEMLNLGANAHLQYKHKDSKYLFWTNYSLINLNDSDFDNNGFAHIRYNYNVYRDTVVMEFFGQSQFNKILDVKFRGLFGFGPRITFVNSNSVKLHFAFLWMYEYQELVNNSIRRNIRMSDYISLKININDKLCFVNTTYWQPLIVDMNDEVETFSEYRLSSQSSFKMKFTKKFIFSVDFSYFYDSNPATEIKKANYYLTNSINYNF